MSRKPRFNLPGVTQHVYNGVIIARFVFTPNRINRELFRMPMDHRQIHAIREALNQELVLGREDFKDKIERMTKRQLPPGQPGRPRVEEELAVYYVL